MRLFFDTKSQNVYVKVVTLQTRLMTSFKLNFGQKMRRFRKVTSENLKMEKLPVTLATSNFQELFAMKCNSKSS